GNITVNGVIPLSGSYDNSQSGNGGGITGQRLDGLSLSYTASYANQNVQYDSNNAPAAQAVTFSNFVLGGQSLNSRWADDSANYRVLNPSVTTQSKILPRPITVDATKSKSYDGTTAIALASSDYAINNVVSGESFSLTANPVRDAGTYSSANAGLRTITVGGYNPSGDLVAGVVTDPANYSLPNVVTGSGTISPLMATVTYTKTYDASATSTITCSPTVVCPGFTITGLPTGFTGAIYTSSGSVLDIAANSAQVYRNGTNYLTSLGTATLQVDAAGGTNYVSASGNILIAAGSVATAPVTINPKALTLSASGLDKTYDATTVLPVGYTLALSGKIGSDDVSLLPAVGSFDSPNAGSRTANLSQLVLTGAQGSNYSVSSTASFGATIAQRLISGLSGSKEYDGNSTFTSANMTPTVNGGSVEALTFTDLASTTDGGTTAQTFGAGVPSSSSFGALRITSAAGDVTSNYSLPGQMLVPLTTIKRTLTLSANDPNTPVWYKVYDGTTATGNGALSTGYEGVSANFFLSSNSPLWGIQPYLRNNQLVALNGTVNAGIPVIAIGNAVSGVPATMNDFSFTGALSSSNAGSTNLVVTPSLSGPSSQYYQLAGGYTFNLPAQIGRVPLNVSVSSFTGTVAAVSRVYDGTSNFNSAAWTSSVTSGSAVGSDNYGSLAVAAKAVTSASDETAIKNVASVSYVMLSPSFGGPQGGNYLPIITSFRDPLGNINSTGTNGFPPTAAPTTTGAYISRISGYSITAKPVTLSASKVYDGTAIY
ncbi:MAG: YDG domain-containing protein, partial [Gallionella sp.]